MNKMRTILLTLLACLLLFTACGKEAAEATTASPDGTTDPTAQTSDVGSDTTAATEETEPAETGPAAPEIAAIDGGQSEFRILGRKSGPDEYYLPFAEFKVDTQIGDVMNDAVYERNLFLEEKYNIKIVADEDTTANVKKAVQTNILANDATYDIYMPTTEHAFGLALEGNFFEIDNIKYVDIEKPWWMGDTMANLSILNDNYFLLGDIAFSNFIASSSVTFNQVLATEYNLPNMYQLVRDGKWTIEKMHEICLQITRDLDGDGDMDNDDLWGASISNFVWQPIYFGSGVNLIEKDASDTPYLVWDSEKNMAVIDRMTAFLNDGNAVLVSQQHSDWKVDNRRNFMESRSLFRVEQLYGLQQIREAEFEYGILPAPKYDEEQEFYYSYVHPKQSQAICIPITNARMDLTGAILEDAAYQSYLRIRPAYYDVTLQGKLARNEDTVEMLNIMLSHLNPDLSVAMVGAGLTIDTDMRSIYSNDLDQYTSVIKASAKVNATLLEKAVAKISGLKK
ncbi:MAG: hypothetical protein IJW99_06860 [Clostridia bacterium]|nr:hypothetical protein [Clostridia bacterium]